MTTEELQQLKEEFHSHRQVCEEVVGLFHLLSNKIRFRIVCTLLHGEACVQDLVEVLGLEQMSNVSQQLRMLRLSGVVTKRRDKRQIVYRIADERIRGLIGFMREHYLQPHDDS
ncbi:ArsR/SmtB family transcription factor [Haloferula sp. A504]|uniref:ArsR/SmtB family transcription factor n=1 Tax=Haloferula sp. A504 TaxID=3373601 RepID=UPI0031BC7578|nr:metalloregulator ArsR/SmtB family transcription factor [Verrucomicrobiaceae bacterium E54]